MSNIFNIRPNNGKQHGFLSLFILHSVKKQPKTDYDLIAKIKEKTEGTWRSSKRTMHPFIKKMFELT